MGEIRSKRCEGVGITCVTPAVLPQQKKLWAPTVTSVGVSRVDMRISAVTTALGGASPFRSLLSVTVARPRSLATESER